MSVVERVPDEPEGDPLVTSSRGDTCHLLGCSRLLEGVVDDDQSVSVVWKLVHLDLVTSLQLYFYSCCLQSFHGLGVEVLEELVEDDHSLGQLHKHVGLTKPEG